jgi:hypothetical protein
MLAPVVEAIKVKCTDLCLAADVFSTSILNSNESTSCLAKEIYPSVLAVC